MTSTVPGFPCPQCANRIVVPMDQLLSGAVVCSRCGLKLMVNQEESAEAIDAVRRLKRRLDTIRR